MSPSARIEGKARNYLGEGRLTVLERTGEAVRASCLGSAAEPYELGHDADAGWFCNCPAFGECAHLRALQLVVVSPPEAKA